LVVSFQEAVERLENGAIMPEHEFDLRVGQLARKYVKEFGIKMNPEEVVNSDDGLADSAFQAAQQLFVELGVYCTNTGRVAKFTEGEAKEAINSYPTKLEFGEGKEKGFMTPRQVEDRAPPWVNFSAVGTPVPSSQFVTVMRSYAQEPLANAFSGPSLLELNGRVVRSGAPVEVEAALFNVRSTREAARLAGRPGLGSHNLVGCAEKTAAVLAALHPDFGVRKTDGVFVAALGEMKVDYERLNKVPFLQDAGYHTGGLYGPLMGGYAGGAAETALVLLAHFYLGRLMFRAEFSNCFPLNIRETCNTTPEMLWLVSLVSQAMRRNTNAMHTMNAFLSSGPCTEMITYELAAHSIAATVSGAHLNPAAPARNKYPERCSGMEARIHAEVGHAVARSGIKRAEANKIVKKLLEKYESKIRDAPVGKKFSECYDLRTVKPSQEYLDIYANTKRFLADLGLVV
jgi:methylamine--corrinoid protein Co-methyltransferase